MRLKRWPYFLKQAILSISNNRMVHAIGTGTMVISLLIFGTFLFLSVNLNNWIHGWGHSLTLSVYLKDDIAQASKEKVASAIRAIPGVEIERFISKEDALNTLKHALGNEAGLLSALSRNPLPASFEIVFKSLDLKVADPVKIKAALEGMEGVNEVYYSEAWQKQFEGIMHMVRLIGIMLGGLLCVGVLFIMTNTIKLTIYSRRHEIEIQKLVGATDWFVRIPFLLEGILTGIISAGASVLLLYAVYRFFDARQIHLLGLVVLDFVFLPMAYVLALFLISIFLGLVGSFIAVGRFITADSFIDL
jgi:cell division transport system permease protein